MRQDLVFEDEPTALAPPQHRRPRLVLAALLFTVLISAAICSLAIVAHAPVAVVPLVVAVSVGSPVFAAWNAPAAFAAVRADRRGRALDRLLRALEQLPETEHPLGL